MKCKIILILYFQTGISQEDFQAEKCSVHHHIDLVIGIFDDFPRVVWSPPIWKEVIENYDIFVFNDMCLFKGLGMTLTMVSVKFSSARLLVDCRQQLCITSSRSIFHF